MSAFKGTGILNAVHRSGFKIPVPLNDRTPRRFKIPVPLKGCGAPVADFR